MIKLIQEELSYELEPYLGNSKTRYALVYQVTEDSGDSFSGKYGDR